MLPKSITKILPVLKRARTCEACGQAFACELNLATGCWCAEIKLSDETRAELRSKYRDCLCRSCMEKAAAGTFATVFDGAKGTVL